MVSPIELQGDQSTGMAALQSHLEGQSGQSQDSSVTKSAGEKEFHPMLTNEELIAQAESGRLNAPDARGQVKPAGGKTEPSQSQSRPAVSPEAQAEIDRLKRQNEILMADATIGRYVRSDENLFGSVTAHMRGGVAGPSGTLGQREPTINQTLGLPTNFVPDPEEFDTPGTDSARWFEEKVSRTAQVVAERQYRSYQDQMRLENEARTARNAFLATGRTEDDLNALLEWVGHGENFSLEKLWIYRQIDTGQLPIVQDQQGAPVVPPHERGYTGSIANVPGEGGGTVPNALKVPLEMLKAAEKGRNLFTNLTGGSRR